LIITMRIVSFFALILLCSCSSNPIIPFGEGGATLSLEDDERRLWKRSEEEEAKLNDSGKIYNDKRIEAYLNKVAEKLVAQNGHAQRSKVVIKVLADPLLNAFSFPNGVIYVHSGILAKIDNEAQLATLLGHEIIHFTHRHMLQQFRSNQRKTAWFAAMQVVSAPFGAIGSLAELLGAVGTVAAITGYSRSLEREADAEGYALIVKGGYDPKEAPELFAHLLEDVSKEKTEEPFLFGTHPHLSDRLENYKSLLKTNYGLIKGKTNREIFQATLYPMLIDNAELDIAAGRFFSAQSILKKALRLHGSESKAHYLLAESYRQSGDTTVLESAEKAYAAAIEQDPNFADPHRGLGMLFFKKGLKQRAQAHFIDYLRLAPSASDKPYIEQYLRDISVH